MYVCICNAITTEEVARLARQGPWDEATIVRTFGLDTEDSCGRCIRSMGRFLPEGSQAQGSCPKARELAAAAR
jgi:bacterioferritin-associated ferredoxin